ncbi:fucose-specific lectin [Apiospora hydei]|uniref:Fucose-specific lectin n=1 Tax=Apiospora hydei TaxID=1337664 RepID=A0ABR1X9Y3_9PEZI
MTATPDPAALESANHDTRYRHYEPGIEVVQSEYDPESVPQVHPNEAESDIYAIQPPFQDERGGQVDHDHPIPDKIPVDQPAPDDRAEATQSMWISKKRRALIISVVILVVIGAVVGSVVGTQVSKKIDGGGATSGESSGNASSAMTGSPTSVNPGLAPTALTWGYPHFEVFALTKNTTSSVYRKFRNINATSENDFMPRDRDMVVVGGRVDTKVAPSISLISYIYTDATGNTQNATQIQIYDKDIQSGHYKFHDDAQVWTPWGWHYQG